MGKKEDWGKGNLLVNVVKNEGESKQGNNL